MSYECDACGEGIDGMIELIEHLDECDPVPLAAESLSRRERNTLLYVENRVVDHAGMLAEAQMNYEDQQNLKLFRAANLLSTSEPERGHVAASDTEQSFGPNELVLKVGYFTDEAFDVVRDCRQIRAHEDDRVDFPVGYDA